MTDFQPHFNPCIIKNQDGPPLHHAKEASWGIPCGREAVIRCRDKEWDRLEGTALFLTCAVPGKSCERC